MQRESAPLLDGTPLVTAVLPVYGLRIPNQEAANLTKKIISLSLVLLVTQATISIIQALVYGQYFSLSSAILCMIVPACGYLGAKWRNKSMLSSFAVCNCLTCVLTPIFLITMISFLEFLKSQYPTVCPPGTTIPAWPDNIDDPTIGGVPATCQSIKDLLDHNSTVYWMMLPLGVVSTLIAFMSCTWGWKLTQLPYFVQPRYAYANAPIATTTVLGPEQVVIVTGGANGNGVIVGNNAYGSTQHNVAYNHDDQKWVPEV
jgi:hypothetical protein|tara:strand:+ start:44 stop:820 length:777 start_codon:yes stop_codon:yes gene_type:complete